MCWTSLFHHNQSILDPTNERVNQSINKYKYGYSSIPEEDIKQGIPSSAWLTDNLICCPVSQSPTNAATQKFIKRRQEEKVKRKERIKNSLFFTRGNFGSCCCWDTLTQGLGDDDEGGIKYRSIFSSSARWPGRFNSLFYSILSSSLRFSSLLLLANILFLRTDSIRFSLCLAWVDDDVIVQFQMIEGLFETRKWLI